ncbi:unnamed protein product [Adineta steineri]|uniref:Uncharacterized protein n=1 Tax=Adineta steineri TaxID=433720 RepID=A0A814V712_9BILA|nr:unnamed protein product [Adineta steineri]CAF1495176.1 unnamed protein product [Adineta steineri]
MTLNHHVLKTLPEYFITTNAEDSTLTDNKSHCTFEILRIHGSESISQIFKTDVWQQFQNTKSHLYNVIAIIAQLKENKNRKK